MTETSTYWICSCGTANHNTDRQCAKCKKRRPLGWKTIAISACAVLILVAMIFGRTENTPDGTILPSTQHEYLAILSKARHQFDSAPNELAKGQVLKNRDKELVGSPALAHGVVDWRGKVRGVSKMGDGAGLNVQVGDSSLIAGEYLGKGLDTVISQESPLFKTVLNLQAGQPIVFSGAFEPTDGIAAEISYGTIDAAQQPQFIFRFSKIAVVP